MNKKKILIVIFAFFAIGVAGYFSLIKKQAFISHTQQTVFASQEECEQKTGKSCNFNMCDYIPQGKTFEEVCGKDFKEGWTPVSSSYKTTASNEWRIFQDSRYAFKFSYPAKWSVGNQQGNTRILILKNEKSSEIITVDTGVNLAVIGISYCSAYPQDKRCETLKVDNGGYVVIDWEASEVANAMFSSQDGTYGVKFSLHEIDSDTKAIFKKVLSTFKFTN